VQRRCPREWVEHFGDRVVLRRLHLVLRVRSVVRSQSVCAQKERNKRHTWTRVEGFWAATGTFVAKVNVRGKKHNDS
jgi:hypothetical protein